MDTALYIAMGGAKRRLTEQGLYSNNLANVNTTGFREDIYVAESFYFNPLEGLPTQTYSASARNGLNTKGGPIMTTGRDLDIAIRGEGWLMVQSPNGEKGLTRNGNFHINASGLLVTSTGDFVLGQGGPITIPPNQSLDIGEDGSISIVPLGQNANTVSLIATLQLVNPDKRTLVKGVNGLVHSTSDEPLQGDPNVRLATRSLEGSNVSAVEQMVSMIDTSKAFEVQVKLMESIDSSQQALAQLLQD